MEGCAVCHGRALDAWVNLTLMTPENGGAPARIAPIGAPMTPEEARRVAAGLEANIARALKGKQPIVELALAALAAGGHLLLEDVPGVGKTTLAHALARSLDLSFARVQFTSDLLPGDITGVSIYDQARNSFVFKPGPLFTNLVLADEINRTTPRTQSCLLEAMAEGQVSVDGAGRPPRWCPSRRRSPTTCWPSSPRRARRRSFPSEPRLAGPSRCSPSRVPVRSCEAAG